MNIKTIAAAALLSVPLIAPPARAEEMTMTAVAAQDLMIGLRLLDCADHDERAQCKSARFVYKGKTMVIIAQDIRALEDRLFSIQTARREVILGLPTGSLNKDGNPDPTIPAARDGIKKINDIMSSEIKVNLIRIALSDLEIDSGAKNNIGANVLAAVMPLLDPEH